MIFWTIQIKKQKNHTINYILTQETKSLFFHIIPKANERLAKGKFVH
jgi:hypothetical protein